MPAARRCAEALLALMLALAPAGASGQSTTTIDNRGRELKALAIACGDHAGTVRINAGVTFTRLQIAFPAGQPPQINHETLPNGVALTYAGSLCADCQWLQFYWREITTGQAVFEDDRGRSHPYTHDRAQPNYTVDSADATDPGYEAGYTHVRDANSNTLLDHPEPTRGIPTDPAIGRQVEVIHLDAYLICNHTACAHVRWTDTFRWAAGSDAPGTATNPGVPAAATIDRDVPDRRMLDQLEAQYPNQTLLPVSVRTR